MREPPRLSEERIRASLRAAYGLRPDSLTFLPLGLDYHAGVYRLVDANGTAYLLKVKAGALYQASLIIPRYLSEQGVAAVVAPIPTRDGALWTSVDGWTLLVYPFVAGASSWDGMTPARWQTVGAVFGAIHRVAPPAAEFAGIRSETFDPSGYARWVEAFDPHAPRSASAAERTLCAAWAVHAATIAQIVATMTRLGAELRTRALPLVICHADLHANNLLFADDDHVSVIDWDDVMLAPKERDFIFVPEESDNGVAPFFRDYGPAEIDWAALAYYRYERVLTDIIVTAQDVCDPNDLSEQTKAEIANLFVAVLAPDDMLADAARAMRRAGIA